MKKLKLNKEGYVLLVTMVLCSLVFFILLYSGAGTADFSLMKEELLLRQALDAALGAEDFSLAEIMYDPTWNEGFDQQHPLKLPNSTINVFFPEKTKNQQYYSLNNYKNTSSAVGWNGRTVPAGYVHLVCNTQTEYLNFHWEALVNPYYRLFFEDFNADSKGSKARNAWSYKGAGHVIEDYYLFMGSNTPGKNKQQYAMAGDDWWTDYSVKANVVYYGNNPFGIIFRAKDFDGYGMMISPMISGEKVVGAAISINRIDFDGMSWTAWDYQYVWPSDTGEANVFTTDNLPAQWLVQVSVQDKKAWVNVESIVNNNKIDWKSKEFDLTDPNAGTLIKNGYMGIWAERNGTGIGVTNVEVDKLGTAMISVPAQW